MLSLPALAGPTVVDDAGREVNLEQPAQRVISLSPHQTENLFSAGAGDTLIATVRHADYPPAAKDLPRLGDARHLDWERLLALQPDLVLLWGSGSGSDTLHRLTQLGIPVYVGELRDVDGIPGEIGKLGILTGRETTAAQAALRFRTELSVIRQRYEDREPVRGFYALWDKPLMTVGGVQIVSQAMKLCGVRNIYDDVDALAPVISLESLIERQPELIIAGAKPEEQAGRISHWQSWRGLQAVNREDWLFVDADRLVRPSMRLIDGLKELCEGVDRYRVQRGAKTTPSGDS